MAAVSFDTWLKPLKVYEVKDNVVTILVPSEQMVMIHIISKKYKLPLQVTICEVTGMPIPDERLSAIPFTRYTKEGQERKELEQKRIKATQRNLYDIPENGVGGEDESSAQ